MTPGQTTPSMPDGVANSARSMPPPLPPLSLPPSGPAPQASPQLTMPPAPASAPAMAAPAPVQPTIHQLMPGLQAHIQDNGMTVYSLPPLTPGGQPQIVDIAPAPKIPRALQPPKGKAQN